LAGGPVAFGIRLLNKSGCPRVPGIWAPGGPRPPSPDFSTSACKNLRSNSGNTLVCQSRQGTTFVLVLFLKRKLALYVQPELPPPNLRQSQKVTAVLQAAAQQDQSRLEIVFEVR
jgi:hypothetical protein